MNEKRIVQDINLNRNLVCKHHEKLGWQVRFDRLRTERDSNSCCVKYIAKFLTCNTASRHVTVTMPRDTQSVSETLLGYIHLVLNDYISSYDCALRKNLRTHSIAHMVTVENNYRAARSNR